MRIAIVIVFLFLKCICVKAQNYSYKYTTYVHYIGNEGPMSGNPGDFFMATLTYSNSSASKINVVMNRYKNEHPAYWSICYCYIQCHSPQEDSILIELLPNSTAEVTLQFKTDSVNPGIAHNAFSIYELGFESQAENLEMTASTLNDVGLNETTIAMPISVYPNPAGDVLHLTSINQIGHVSIYNTSGDLIASFPLKGDVRTIPTAELPPGAYHMILNAEGAQHALRFIKQ